MNKYVFVFLIYAMFFSCDIRSSVVLEKEHLFTLELGRLEDQIDLFSYSNALQQTITSIFMHNGIVYIGNGPANKVMEFTSFGDMVRIFYNPHTNPQPVGLSSYDGNIQTRLAIPYSFVQLGEIAVDSRKRLYVVDEFSEERSVFDEELQVRLSRVVLRFDEDGGFLDYLGQEGIGGTPFPFINQLQITLDNRLAVVTSTFDSRRAYFFDADGTLLYVVQINLDNIPIPDTEQNYIAILDTVMVGIDAGRVYLKVSYYHPIVDQEIGEEYSIGFDHARLYWLNLSTEEYEGFVELPYAHDENIGAETQYELLGVSKDENIFLLSRYDSLYTRLTIMEGSGKVLRRRNIYMPEVELVYRHLALSAEGVITALLGYEDRVEIVWWRGDRLLSRERLL